MIRELIREYIQLLKEEEERIHTVVSNENLSVIANKYNVTVGKLMKANPDANPDALKIGMELKIPAGYVQLNKYDKDKNERTYSDKLETFIKGEEGKPGTGEHYPFTYDDAIQPTRPWKKGDPIKGNLTIGWGQKQRNQNPATAKAQKMTSEEAQVFLDKSLSIASDLLKRSVTESGYNKPVIPFTLSQNQFDALTSVIFNCGQQGYLNSSLHKSFISKGKIGTPAFKGAFESCCVSEGGHKDRRKKEYEMFMGIGYFD